MSKIRPSRVFLFSALFAGCVAPQNNLTLNLRPAWIGLLFSDDASPTEYIDKDGRQWLAASAYFIYKMHEPLTSTIMLNEFLADQFGSGTQLKPPYPREIAPGMFSLPLRTGRVLTVKVNSTTLDLETSDIGLTAALLDGIAKYSAPSSARREGPDMSLTKALVSALLVRPR